MRQFLKGCVLATMLAGCLSFSWGTPAAAQTFDQEFNLNDQGLTSIDFNQISLTNLGKVTVGGKVASDAAAGLPVDRQWKAGDALATVLRLGDVPSLGSGQFSVEQIGQIVEFTPDQVQLSRFNLLTSQPLPQLVQSIPYLKNFPVREVAPIAALVNADGDDARTVAMVVSQLDVAKRSLADLGDRLKQFHLSDLPNAAATPLLAFAGWQQQSFADIPGLSEVPLTQMPQPILNDAPRVARIESMGTSQVISKTVTGSSQIGFHVSCPERNSIVSKSCTGLVLADSVEPSPMTRRQSRQERDLHQLSGKQWVLGSSQSVPGGYGALQFLPSSLGFDPGYEPTGRHPFGAAFKQVLTQIDGQTVSSALVFRICARESCSPYNQFSVPFLRYPVGSSIVVGADSENSGDSSSLPVLPLATSSYENVNPGRCTGESVGGISVSTLTSAIAAVDSEPSEPTSVGLFVCHDGQCGRLLGQYQLPSNTESVQSAITAKPGGKDWLEAIASGKKPKPAELLQYFPPELQTQVLTDNTKSLLKLAQAQVEPQAGTTWQDNRLIERVAQMSAGGTAAAIGGDTVVGLKGLTLKQYGVESRLNYEAQGGGVGLQCSVDDLRSQSAAQTPTAQIASTLSRLGKFSTASSPGKGKESAALAVNQVLSQAGIRSLGEHPNYIPSIESELRNGRGAEVAPDQAEAGDIVIAAKGRHIGICLDEGCQTVRSNNGTLKSFGWDSSRDFDGKLNDSTIYRITQP
ncbi:hypothetical protein H6F87_26250 [Cyanobacteria bacterium FACHB-502]|nr:hypothetical protein [Cyanobacteria bacterium FACHB-502]